jgi:hypothetical protein
MLRAYVCIHVFDGTAPVTLVTRLEGEWCFLCGQVHDNRAESYRVIGIGHLIDNDQSLSALTQADEAHLCANIPDMGSCFRSMGAACLWT